MKKLLLLLLFISLFSTAFSFTSQDNRIPNKFIVRFDDESQYYNPVVENNAAVFGAPQLDNICRRFGVSNISKFVSFNPNPDVWTEIDLEKIFCVYISASSDLDAAIQAFNSAPGVLYAEPVFIRKVFFTPNDTYFSQQWGLNNTHTQAELAWNYAQGNSAVKIAIVDSGMDMDHPDLVGNLWVNPGEDLNGNGVVDPSDRNNLDDDANGYIDDFSGWDFMYDDNDPNDDWPAPEGGHGTHCAGIAAAQTNNGVGVASLSFDCSVIPIRTGEGIYIYAGNEGVAYALNLQADIVSLSWGGGGFSMLEQDMYNQAFNNGTFVVAAAGNDNTSEPMYPAGYGNVFAVASTTQNDTKSSFSNYGAWVDIAAPGSNIFSTYLNASYTNMSGTSMACPFTASLAGLVKGAFPDMTPADLAETIQSTSDNIYPLNPNYIGMLGAGRINAYKALGMLYTPDLVMVDYIIQDDGNFNGSPEPGENCEVTVEIANSLNYVTATGIQVYLSCAEPGITVTNPGVIYPDLPGGSSYVNNDNPFAFSVDINIDPGYAVFYISAICQPNNFTLTDSFTVLIGVPDILIVDDDGGQNNFQSYYLGALESINRNYEYWDNSLNYLMYDQITQYETVIWFTGNSQTYTIDSYEQYLLMEFLNNGGNLFLSGQYIGDDIHNSDFYSDYLHSSLLQSNVSLASLEGVPGNPVSSGTNLMIVGISGAGNGMLSPSSIEPLTPAEPLYTYTNGQAGGILYNGDYKLVYLEFAFEAVSGMGNPPTTSRSALMGNILNWFDSPSTVSTLVSASTADFTLNQNYPNPFNPVTQISFSLAARTSIELSVYDILGRQITILASGELAPGEHSYSFSAENLPSGIYFANLAAANTSQRIKMLIIK